MGTKGEKRTAVAKEVAEEAVLRLAAVGGVRCRGMFGGYGLFTGDVMFALVNAKGQLHLRVDDTTRGKLEEVGGEGHGRMPYVSVVDVVWQDPVRLLEWANEAAGVARAANS